MKDGAWVIRSKGVRERTSQPFDTQLEAVKAARSEAKRQGADLVIYSRDGRIRDVDRYTKRPSIRSLIRANSS